MKFEWEVIDQKNYGRASRAKVFGGWILRSETWDEGSQSESMVFIPDPKHEWLLDR